jgi:hypothetical protein
VICLCAAPRFLTIWPRWLRRAADPTTRGAPCTTSARATRELFVIDRHLFTCPPQQHSEDTRKLSFAPVFPGAAIMFLKKHRDRGLANSTFALPNVESRTALSNADPATQQGLPRATTSLAQQEPLWWNHAAEQLLVHEKTPADQLFNNIF